MGDIKRGLIEVHNMIAGVGGDLEMQIEEEGRNTPGNRLRLKTLMNINDLVERAIKLADRQGL